MKENLAIIEFCNFLTAVRYINFSIPLFEKSNLRLSKMKLLVKNGADQKSYELAAIVFTHFYWDALLRKVLKEGNEVHEEFLY